VQKCKCKYRNASVFKVQEIILQSLRRFTQPPETLSFTLILCLYIRHRWDIFSRRPNVWYEQRIRLCLCVRWVSLIPWLTTHCRDLEVSNRVSNEVWVNLLTSIPRTGVIENNCDRIYDWVQILQVLLNIHVAIVLAMFTYIRRYLTLK